MSAAVALVDELLLVASQRHATDLHVTPQASDVAVTLRVDGLVEPLRTLDRAAGQAAVLRLMAMARLLTYRLDVPQEGRCTVAIAGQDLELRVSVMPTTHGLRCAVRMPGGRLANAALAGLALPTAVLDGIGRFVRGDAGLLLIVGPAGSGKTTTLYGVLHEVLRVTPGVSIVSVEDPVERDLPGVAQIEVTPFGQLTFARAIRSTLRQDPQVLAIGEIRDAETAGLALQAALSGHRLVATLHAGTAGSAVARLLEMGLERYRVAGALVGVINQRLVRRKSGDGYQGRLPVAEYIDAAGDFRKAILAGHDAHTLDAAANPRETIANVLDSLIAQGLTDQPERHRLLGPPAAAARPSQWP